MNVQEFLNQTKAKCEANAKVLASLELSIWDKNHETELKQYFGFTSTSVANRKKELEEITK